MGKTINWEELKKVEHEDNPKMLELYHEQSWQNAFCFALALEESEKTYQNHKIMLTIIAGSDSTMQSIKAAIDLGIPVSFGHGKKTNTQYEFVKEYPLISERGKYEKFSMTINQNRKALAIVHEELLGNHDYIMCFDGDPAEAVARTLGNGKYGLHILPEWRQPLYDVLVERNYLEEVKMYVDTKLFPDGIHLYRLRLEEPEADTLISELVKTKKLLFPKEGSGSSLQEVEDLTKYMVDYSDDMVEKLNEEVQPGHNPMVDSHFESLDTYPRQLFPVQSHSVTATVKRLDKQKAVIINGEMSTGKSTMMTAVADTHFKLRNKKGYHVAMMVPPTLTAKWPEEIRYIVPNAKVIVVRDAKDIIDYHNEWTSNGRPKPSVPTFFVISFTTMRNDCATVPAVEFQYEKTKSQREENKLPYRYGFYCTSCGKPHQVIEDTRVVLNEEGIEEEQHSTHSMSDDEFGNSRRIKNASKPQNAFCYHCGDSLWTKKVPTRYSSFKDWSKHEKELIHAVKDGNKRLVAQVQSSQPEIPKVVGKPRKVAVIEYIRRRMKNFFDMSIIDEVHELKSSNSAQGNSLGALASVSKKVVAGTGTLFGGRADDIFYLLFRLFPSLMVEAGYEYSGVRKFIEEYGNIEKTTYRREDPNGEMSNSQSRGGNNSSKEKILPGYSPFIFSRFIIQNVIMVKLKDVWVDAVPYTETPTILVDMESDQREAYQDMISTFEREIDEREDGFKLYLPLTMNGVAYPDNPFTYPTVDYLNMSGEREVIWVPKYLDENRLLPKEKKLQELVEMEMAEGRPCIVYIRDTGTSNEGRDVQPRLQKVLEQIGAKVAILRTNTTKPYKRSDWLKDKVEKEGVNVIITNMELVKVGLDLLSTPTCIYYQFPWSLYTLNQSMRRSWRIGQTEEVRIFFLAYKDTFQESMAELIARKNKAAAAISGEMSSDGLAAMLGDEGDLQSMLIEQIKKGTKVQSSLEDWVASTSERARELMANIGKKKPKSLSDQFMAWVRSSVEEESTRNVLLRKTATYCKFIENDRVPGFLFKGGVLEVDLIEAFGIDLNPEGHVILDYFAQLERPTKAVYGEEISLMVYTREEEQMKKSKKKAEPADGQLVFELFA
ncbi:helicase-related protein [Bacillus salitolerans]|uniref:Helicase-related protein n=1 Tax=Bacillus salitolerans TaxID=1437434 RepID=A0ABW4LM48_9BACI